MSFILGNHTNIILGDNKATKNLLLSSAASVIDNYTGFNPGSRINDKSSNEVYYSTTPVANYFKPIGDISDFRARLSTSFIQAVAKARKDGTYSTFNLSPRSLAYSIASMSPLGAYGTFNLNAGGKRGFGWGSHGAEASVFKSDFTLQSIVATKWNNGPDEQGKWVIKYRNVLTPFRGDKVNVIDYSKRSLKEAYIWKPKFGDGKSLTQLGGLNPNETQDFIKFFLTGPALVNGSDPGVKDDIMVFRATINSLEDTFSPQWSPVTFIGRADPNYTYTGFSRDMRLSFDVYATDRDELKPIWRKLNALAGYTAPTYDKASIGLIGPWMRITIGDLYKQQPVIIDSLSYTLTNQDTTWEINIENDPEMKQVPHRVSVTMGFKMITEYLPQKNGQFYTLSKYNNQYGPSRSTNNWLTDSTNVTLNDELSKQRGGTFKLRLKEALETLDVLTDK